jgi:predicted sugar kinase
VSWLDLLVVTSSLHELYIRGRRTSVMQSLTFPEDWHITHTMKTITQKRWQSLQDKTEVNINLTMTTLKLLSARWLVSAIDYLKANPKIVYNGFHNALMMNRFLEHSVPGFSVQSNLPQRSPLFSGYCQVPP